MLAGVMHDEAMKFPEIKCWDCEAHDPIEEWVPDDPENVDFWCNVGIGIAGEDAYDNFYVHVLTHRALAQVDDHSYLVVVPYYESWELVLDTIRAIALKCPDINWRGMSEQLSKHFLWEYERSL